MKARSLKPDFGFIFRFFVGYIGAAVAFFANMMFAFMLGYMGTQVFSPQFGALLFLTSFLCSNLPIYLTLWSHDFERSLPKKERAGTDSVL